MKKLSLFVLMMATMFVASAQMLNPAKVSCSVKETSATEAELIVTVKLDAGWHMYSQHTDPNGPIATTFEFTKSKDYALVGKVNEPKPHEENDPLFGCVVKSFEGIVVFKQKIKRLSQNDFTVKGMISFQLCNNGSCIPPEDHDIVFKVKGATETQATGETPMNGDLQTNIEEVADTATADSAAAIADSTTADTTTKAAAANNDNGKGNTKKEKEEHSLLMKFLIALGGGILTMFTPCVFPMIPMTVNFFLRGAENKRKGRRQAWIFGLSIVGLFTVIGAILTLIFGPHSLYLMGTHWIPNLIFFIIFFIFALSFFGLFEIKMPEKWVNASDEKADKGGFLAPFFIALTTVLVSFSCTGPIIGTALVGLSTSTTDRLVPLITMLGFGIGFALPFTLLAFFPQFLKNMKSGSWLNTVKVSFAFLELAFGLKFLQQADLYCDWGILPRDIFLALWIVIFALWGFYLLGKLRFKGDDPVEHIGTGRLMMAIIDLAFVVYMIPGLWGAELKAIKFMPGLVPPMESQDFYMQKVVNEFSGNTISVSTDNNEGISANRKYAHELHVPLGFEAFFDLDEAKEYARKVGKPIFVDFTGKTCANCRNMEQHVWTNSDVKKILTSDFVMVSLFCDANIDLPESEWVTDKNGKTYKTLGTKNFHYQQVTYNTNTQPYYIIIDADGKTLTNENYSFDLDVKKFVDWLNEGKNNFKK
ncbi:MAG: thioredoxin family protein [Bacteroidales bacterium]|nr:thioredoxin family protein [Bacteroidales bacterium]